MRLKMGAASNVVNVCRCAPVTKLNSHLTPTRWPSISTAHEKYSCDSGGTPLDECAACGAQHLLAGEGK